MDTDFGRLPDDMDLLEDRQDLSQYSFDPNDFLETVSTFPISQQSSQTSDKPDVFLGPHCDADGVVDRAEVDLFEFLNGGPLSTIDNTAVSMAPLVAESSGQLSSQWFIADAREIPSVDEACPETVHNRQLINSVKAEAEQDCCSESLIVAAYSPESMAVSSTELTDRELVSLPTRELNRRLQAMSPDERRAFKQRRRTLKNRSYAQTCRSRRVGHRRHLESINDGLHHEVEQLQQLVDSLTKERDQLREDSARYKAECERFRDLMHTMLTSNNGLATDDVLSVFDMTAWSSS